MAHQSSLSPDLLSKNLCKLPTPHGEKLFRLLKNSKLPASDHQRIESAIQKYQYWLQQLKTLPFEEQFDIKQAVDLLNEYRFFLDIQVIFDSPNDFLYRQKGQLKLESSVIEEFLPHLVAHKFPSLCKTSEIGPAPTFLGLYFEGGSPYYPTKVRLKEKDQDFAVYKRVQIVVTALSNKKLGTHSTNIAYLCAECKTNLDKTMFQEAASTASEVKRALPTAKYLLISEWLDMTPISTAGLPIDEVLILRKARRLNAELRKHFGTSEGRKTYRDMYVRYLKNNPFYPDVFQRFLWHIQLVIQDKSLTKDVLIKGYF